MGCITCSVGSMKKDTNYIKAINLRRKGLSFREISEELGISKSTASLWSRRVELSENARKRIDKLGVAGRQRAAETNKKKREEENKKILEKIKRNFTGIVYSEVDYKIECALLYWCEGTKYEKNTSVSFINADPEMIKYFLCVFRKSFDLDEKKFRALIHLHEYHDAARQLKFWSDITKIPISQFNKPYLKKNTGKNKKDSYPGCVSIRYSDNKIYKEIIFMIKKLIKIQMRG
jgi:transposase